MPLALMLTVPAISIHAPRVGSDFFYQRATVSAINFNPRSPCGERHLDIIHGLLTDTFQSTLPVWGATFSSKQHTSSSNISIHAPRVGSDNNPTIRRMHCSVFQSTLPVWGATPWTPCWVPCWGYFNPRSPCGERRAGHPTGERQGAFQSTLPVWGATLPAPPSGRR